MIGMSGRSHISGGFNAPEIVVFGLFGYRQCGGCCRWQSSHERMASRTTPRPGTRLKKILFWHGETVTAVNHVVKSW